MDCRVVKILSTQISHKSTGTFVLFTSYSAIPLDEEAEFGDDEMNDDDDEDDELSDDLALNSDGEDNDAVSIFHLFIHMSFNIFLQTE